MVCPRWFRVVPAGLLLAALALPSGCAKIDKDGVNVGIRSYGGIGAGGKPPVERYVSMRAKKKTVGGFAFVSIVRDLWEPFRWEVKAGLFDPEHANVGPGFFCTELDARGTDPLQFYALCAQPVTQPSSGLNVFVSSHNGNHGQVFMPGANVVDFAVEHDGTNLLFSARPAGGGAYMPVASIPLADQQIALLPSLGVSNIGQGAEAGFDDFRVVSNGVSPLALTPEQAVARAIWDDAIDPGGEALYAMDGFTPDYVAAGTHLDEALAGLDARIPDAQALTQSKDVKKAVSKLNAARGKMEKAFTMIGQDKPPQKIINKIGAAVDDAFEATELLDPLETPQPHKP